MNHRHERVQSPGVAKNRERIGVVYVTYRPGDDLARSLQLLLGSKGVGIDLEVTVVDNSGGIGAAEIVSVINRYGVRLVQNKRNIGFGPAVNIATRLSDRRLVLILNPDVAIDKANIKVLIDCMEEHGAVAVSPRLVYPDGQLQLSCRNFPNWRTIVGRRLFTTARIRAAVDRHLMKAYDHMRPMAVDWCLGACILIDLASLGEKEVFDERFFLYMEDVDLGYRFRLEHKTWFYCPAATAQHLYRRESKEGFINWTTIHHLKSAWKFFHKHGFSLIWENTQTPAR